VLTAGETLSCFNVSDGNERWQAAIPELPVWARFVADVLIVGTATTAIGVAPEDGRILWQRSFGSSAGDTAAANLSFRATAERLCCLSTASGLWSLFPETGEVAWGYHPPRGALQARWHCSSDRLVVQQLAPDLWDVIDPRDGTLLAEGAGPVKPWRDDPVLLSFDRLLASVDDLSAPQILDVKQGTVVPFGDTPLAIASKLSDRSHGDAALVAVIDSDRLARFDPVSGSKLWSCRAGVERLFQPQSAICQDSERLYAVTAGVMRCHALDDGRMLWEQYVGPRGDWSVERAGPWLVAFRQTSADRGTIVLCDPASGEFVERLNSDGRTNSVRFHSEADQAIVVTDTRLIGFRPAAANND
jgi:outer membrane protein assembly factor BamB